ncbi:hypothetical protein RchiOBHm_Chr2g0132801 [Rosa chinensis]|uniref:Uncharacterized protein n=1 Tax=Rosa chinensis TaxID=74649 RepID=A0A2P6RVG1_ROSCH|nr:hypothetical protein RchiOBHm_Chr2g0132801 [Rosa chinensis]
MEILWSSQVIKRVLVMSIYEEITNAKSRKTAILEGVFHLILGNYFYPYIVEILQRAMSTG